MKSALKIKYFYCILFVYLFLIYIFDNTDRKLNKSIFLFTFVMKCSEAYRILIKDGWVKISHKGSHIKLKHAIKPGVIIFPDHGNNELGKGLQKKLFKQAGIK